MQDKKSLKQIMDFRKEKLNILKENNINPFPANYKPTHFSASIKENYEVKSFFNTRINDYKLHASIYTLFEIERNT